MPLHLVVNSNIVSLKPDKGLPHLVSVIKYLMNETKKEETEGGLGRKGEGKGGESRREDTRRERPKEKRGGRRNKLTGWCAQLGVEFCLLSVPWATEEPGAH